MSEIDRSVFEGCTGLTAIDIPNSVTVIGERAFKFCKGLTSITIPQNVNKIGEEAFSDCDNLESIVCKNPTPAEAEYFTFTYTQYHESTLYVPVGSASDYQKANPWSNFKNIKEGELSGINDIITDSDSNAPVEVYDLNGVRIADSTANLPKGIYVIRRGNSVEKIIVK